MVGEEDKKEDFAGELEEVELEELEEVVVV